MTETALGALLIILAGALARRAGILGPEDGAVLVRVVIYLALPPLVFLIIARADLEGSLLLVPVAGWGIHLALLGIAVVCVRLWGMDRPRAGAVVVATAVGNTGFFGLPLIAASGDGFSLPAAVMYDSLATGLITWTSTVAVAGAYGRAGTDGPRVELRDLGRALLLPPNWALVLGLLVNVSGVELSMILETPLELMGAAVLPLVMIYAGLMIEFRGLGRVWREIGYTAVVRLGAAALVGLGAARLLDLGGETLNTIVIMAAMPTALMSLVIGARSGLRADVLAGAVVVTTLLSIATLPLVRHLLL